MRHALITHAATQLEDRTLIGACPVSYGGSVYYELWLSEDVTFFHDEG